METGSMISVSTAVPLTKRITWWGRGFDPRVRWPAYKDGVVANPMHSSSSGFCFVVSKMREVNQMI